MGFFIGKPRPPRGNAQRFNTWRPSIDQGPAGLALAGGPGTLLRIDLGKDLLSPWGPRAGWLFYGTSEPKISGKI